MNKILVLFDRAEIVSNNDESIPLFILFSSANNIKISWNDKSINYSRSQNLLFLSSYKENSLNSDFRITYNNFIRKTIPFLIEINP